MGLNAACQASSFPNDSAEACGVNDVRPVLARRLRLGAAVALAATALTVLGDGHSSAHSPNWLFTVQLLQALFLLAVWLCMRAPALVARASTVAVVAVIGVSATLGVTGVLRGSVGSAAMLLLFTVVGAALILPWGLRRQVLVVTGAGIVLAACVFAIGGSTPQLFSPELLPVALGFCASLYAAYELERHRRAANRHTRALQLRDAALSAAANGIFITGPDGIIRWVNPAFADHMGYARDELIGQTPGVFGSSDQNREFFEKFRTQIGAGKVWRGEIVNRRKDGTQVPMEMTITPVLGRRGAITHFVAVEQDISERLAAEQALRRSEQHFRSLIHNAPDLITLVDAAGTIQYDSPAIERMLGYAVGERYGRDALAGIHTDDLDTVRAAFMAFAQEPDATTPVSFRYRHKNGSWRHLEAVGRNLLHDAAVGALVINSHDATERVLAEENLARAKEAAETANRAKTEFLARMSHEIHTPLNAILGMTEIAMTSPLAPEPRECLETARGAARALVGLVDDILDLAKLEAGQLVLDRSTFAVREELAPTVQIMTARARQRGLAFDWSVAEEVPVSLIGDSRRLSQVMRHMVGNAIKFTEHGRVDVSITLVDAALGSDDAVLHVRVRDTGPGFAPDKIESLVAPFEVADSSNSRRYGGTGLGLSIARALIHMMGGRLWVQSEPGEGSTFHFTVRLALQPATAVTRAAEPENTDHDENGSGRPVQPLRLLVVEDNLVNQRVMVRLAERRGHAATVAGNGREALQCLAEQAFDVVLMDVQMPVMDGIEATVAIRESESETSARMPIVAVTAHAMKTDEERCLAAGMDAYVAKPFDADRLFSLVERLASEAARRREGAAGSGEPDCGMVAPARSRASG